MTDINLQGSAHDISDEARKALARARKILDLASRPPDDNDTPAQRAAKENERKTAAERYQAVLLEYNLTQAQVDQTGDAADGRREEAKLKAGMYEWQRELWESIAELNFCLYYCTTVYREKEVRGKHWDGTRRTFKRWTRGKQHEVIGRAVNTQATINLATYLEAAIERETREELARVVGSSDKAAINPMLFSRYAVSFREGAADDVVGRVNEQRRAILRKEREAAKEAQRRAEEARTAGDSDGTALVIATYVQTERDLNYDHMLGREPGTTAKMRAERAAAEAAEEARYTAWAAANPEEAAKKAEEERKENERYWARRRGNYRGGPAPKARDHRAYRKGSVAGAGIGLDIQTGTNKPKGALS